MKIKKRKKQGKKWVAWLIAILSIFVIAIIAVAPFLIQRYIHVVSPSAPKNDSFTMSDYLSYFGAILGFLGATALAALALWQNHKLHQVNMKILENEQRYTGIPQFEIENIDVSYINAFLDKTSPLFIEKNGCWETELVTHDPADQECEMTLEIQLKNVGNGLAKNLKAIYVDPGATYDMLKNSKDASIWSEEVDLRFVTQVGTSARFSYPLPLLMDEKDSDHRSVTLEYTNLYDYKYLYFLYIEYRFVSRYVFKVSVKITNYDTF